jgi:integrase
MTGHVRRRGERSWELKFDAGSDPSTGRRITRYSSFRGTKRDAEVELAKLVTAAANGEQVDPSKLTVNEFLDRWERDWCAGNVSPKTRERYGELLRIHVRPTLGALKIQRLRPVHLSGLYGALLRDSNLAARTVGHVHRALHRALGHATAWDIVQQNIAARVVPPRVAHQEMAILTPAQVRVVLETARGRAIFPIATLALATGMRRGELLALRWQDIDLNRAKITVARSLEQTKAGLRFKEPKTTHGRRTISLPATAVAELRTHWRAQQQQRLALGAGKSPPDALVFADLNGRAPLAECYHEGMGTHRQGGQYGVRHAAQPAAHPCLAPNRRRPRHPDDQPPHGPRFPDNHLVGLWAPFPANGRSRRPNHGSRLHCRSHRLRTKSPVSGGNRVAISSFPLLAALLSP